MTSVSDPELATDDEQVTPESPEPGFFQRFNEGVSRIPLRTRIGLLVMLAVGAAVAVASLASYLTVRNQILRGLDHDLLTSAYSLESNPPRVPIAFVDAQAGIIDSTGQVLEGDPQVPVGVPEEKVAGATGDVNSVRTVAKGGHTYRVVAIPWSHQGLGSAALVIARPMDDTQNTLDRLSTVSILVGIAGIAAAGMAGFAIGRAGLRPVERLTEAAEYVASTGDLRPIEVRGSDELARLTTSFNAMLTGLRRSQDHQRRLVADAGHELRTPLTSMRTNIELLTQSFSSPAGRGLSAAERDELMDDVRAQMEELSILVTDLVELSRDEHPSAATRDQVDLADIVRQAVERVRRRAPDLEYDLHVESWVMEGDPAALERMVTNLLDNAAKWSPPKGMVRVELSDGHLQVADEGPGIADEDLTHVFERFYRSPEARMLPGSGLGLAIVRQVAEHHGGRVAAARAPMINGHGGGALLGVWLPRSGSETASAGTA